MNNYCLSRMTHRIASFLWRGFVTGAMWRIESRGEGKGQPWGRGGHHGKPGGLGGIVLVIHDLVGGCIPTPLKNMRSSIGMIIATQY